MAALRVRNANTGGRGPWVTRRFAAVLLLALLAASCGPAGGGIRARSGPRTPVPRPSPSPTPTPRPAAVESGLLPWQLSAPLSREAVFAGSSPSQLILAGGLLSSGDSTAGIDVLDTTSGRQTVAGNLSTPTHDVAAAAAGQHLLVLGGGTAAPSASTERLAPSGQQTGTGSLPQPRADASAATIGDTAYLVGGYNGPATDGAVLATTDGAGFTKVAALPVPVRYPAVATLAGMIYVFGGETLAGSPVAAIQRVNPATHQAALVGSLPAPLSGAIAAALGGDIYIAGGVSPAASGLQPVSSVYAYLPGASGVLAAGSLQVAVSNAGGAVVGGRLWIVGGETVGGTPSADVQMLIPNAAFGEAGVAGAASPLYGDQLLIADRGNNRLLVMNDTGNVVWTYPSASAPAPPGGFYFPDDAFFAAHGTAIVSNQEENETVVEISFPAGHLMWSYGHPGVAGSAPGYLHNPDDAYLLPNGDITVADPMNCRVLVITQQKRVATQIGTPGACLHRPPHYLGSPNGDTPLQDGNLLVSEINGSWIDEVTPSGKLVWSVKLPIGYPSDPQQIGPDLYLVADYEKPGGIVEFNRSGQILYQYRPTSGPGALDHPSLVEQLPSGVLMLNDDNNDRLVAIDPTTNALVWQYGVTGVAGTAPGMLNTPDGFDVLGAGGSTPTHPATG